MDSLGSEQTDGIGKNEFFAGIIKVRGVQER